MPRMLLSYAHNVAYPHVGCHGVSQWIGNERRLDPRHHDRHPACRVAPVRTDIAPVGGDDVRVPQDAGEVLHAPARVEVGRREAVSAVLDRHVRHLAPLLVAPAHNKE